MVSVQHFLAAAAITWSAAALAQPAGYVKTVTGTASVTTNGQSRAAVPGMPLAAGDVLTTGAPGTLGVTLRDNTVMSFGPSTSFALSDYLFAPARGQLQLNGRIHTGTMHYISGTIAKLRPEAVEISTPTGIIGVRGTRFVVVVAD